MLGCGQEFDECKTAECCKEAQTECVNRCEVTYTDDKTYMLWCYSDCDARFEACVKSVSQPQPDSQSGAESDAVSDAESPSE